MRVALLEMLHPDAVPGDTPIPPEGAIDEAVETREGVLRRRGARLRQRHPRRGRCASMRRRMPARMTDADADQLDDLDRRASSAPPSSCARGELVARRRGRRSSRSARALAARGRGRARAPRARGGAEPPPGQDALL